MMNESGTDPATASDRPRSHMVAFATALILLTGFALLMAFGLIRRDSATKQMGRTGLEVGRPAPDFSFPDLDGKMVSLSDYRGRVVLVNIWATWCKTCVWEMPSMQKLYERFKDDGFEILAVSIDVLGSKVVAPFMKKYRLTFPALLDPMGKVQALYATTGVPESFIVNQEGILVKKVIGPIDWATAETFQFFEDLIGNSQS